MNPYRYKISLRIKHPSLDPAEISAALGLAPSRAWRVGERRTGSKGAPLEGVNKESYWTANVAEGQSDAADIPAAIHAVVDDLANHEPLLKRLRTDGGKIELFVGWFFENANSGEEFDPDLLGRLAALGIGISLDVYGGPSN